MVAKGSKTEENLRGAFAAEAEMKRKYGLFARAARAEGYEEIAAVFSQAAAHGGVHSELWFEALGGCGSTAENLLSAAEGEAFAWVDTYERYACEAEEEGEVELAFRFRAVGSIKKRHEEHFRHLLSDVREGRVFVREEEIIWECRRCGHLRVGRRAPDACPVCRGSRAYFEAR